MARRAQAIQVIDIILRMPISLSSEDTLAWWNWNGQLPQGNLDLMDQCRWVFDFCQRASFV
jgi:hypothetical protein